MEEAVRQSIPEENGQKFEPMVLDGDKKDKETKKQRAEKFVDFLLANYTNEQDGLLSISDIARDQEKEDIIRDLVDEDNGTEKELFEIASEKEIVAALKSKIENTNSTLEKIIIASFLTEAADDLMLEGKSEQVENLLNIIRQEADKEDTPTFANLYLKHLIQEGSMEKLLYGETEETEGVSYNAKQFHQTKMRKLSFVFDKETINELFVDDPEDENDAPSAIDFGNEDEYEWTSGDYIVGYLTPDTVGIYRKKGELVGYAKITPEMEREMNTDRSNLEEEMEAPDFEIDNLTDIQDRLPEDMTREDLALFKIMESLPMREMIKNELGIDIANFSLRVQHQFLKFATSKNTAEFKKFKELITNSSSKEEKKNKVIAFLSLEEGEEMGEKLYTILEKTDKQLATNLLTKYAEIYSGIEKAGDYIRENFRNDSSFDERTLEKMVQQLLARGKKLLTNYSDQENGNIEELSKNLAEYKTDIDIFSSAFVSIFKGKENVDFSEVRGLDFQRQSIDWLTDIDKEEMLKISEKNWLPLGKAGEGVVSEFSDTLKHGEDIDFYVLKKDGEVVAFIRFDKPTPDGHRYAGSFNVDSDYRGSAMGEAVIKNALDKEADKYILDATVYPQIQVGTKYVEETGFAITNVLPNYDNSGETFFEITCDKRSNELYTSRKATQEQLIAQHHDNNWKEKLGNNLIVLKFDPEKENDEVIQTTQELIANEYIGNRYFSDPKDKTKRYYVFEIKKAQEEKLAEAV